MTENSTSNMSTASGNSSENRNQQNRNTNNNNHENQQSTTGNNNNGNNTHQRRQNHNNNNNHNSRNNNRNNQRNNVFKGETPGMGGHVFQIHSEQTKRGQFQDTLDALKVYSSTTFRKEITSLNKLFTQLKTPEVVKPKDPPLSKVKNEDGTFTNKVSRFDETVYNEEVKQWIKDNKNLRSTLTALYNIVWGQCSRLMKNKLKAIRDFDSIEEESDVTQLLKEI
jgi:hypothetical protein